VLQDRRRTRRREKNESGFKVKIPFFGTAGIKNRTPEGKGFDFTITAGCVEIYTKTMPDQQSAVFRPLSGLDVNRSTPW
jgi:hypothetical protein